MYVCIFTITAKFLHAHWLIFVVNKWTDTKMMSDVACALSQWKIKAKSTRNLSLLLLKTNCRQFFFVCPVIDHEFRHYIVN